MKKLEIQTSFTAGELSPKGLHGQVDLNKYKSALKTATNCVVNPLGPIERRAGTKYIAEVKDSSKTVRLIKFTYDTTYTYILELGNQYIRFYRNSAQVTSGGSPVEVSTPYLEAELFDVSYTQFGNTIYFAHGSYAPRKLVWAGDTSWTLSTINFYPAPTYESGYKPAATLTPSATTGTSINFTASAAVFNAGMIGRTLANLVGNGRASIISYTSTTVVVCDIITDFPNTSAIASQSWVLEGSPISKIKMDGYAEGASLKLQSFYPDSALGSIKTITGITNANPGVVSSTAHGFSNGDKVLIQNVLGMTQVNNRIWTVKNKSANAFDLANDDNANFDTTNYTAYTSGGQARQYLKDIGKDVIYSTPELNRYWVLNNGIVYITAVTDAQTATGVVLSDLETTDSTTNWTSETPSWTAGNGYPATVSMHQQRLWFGSTSNDPQTIWASQVSDFENFARGSQDAAGLDLTLSTREINRVTWAAPLRNDLVVGTSSSELTIGSSANSAITPATVSQQSRSYNGSGLQTPVLLSNEILYTPRSTKKLFTTYYDFSTDSYKSEDLTFLASHLPENGLGIKQATYADIPKGIIYCVLNSGDLIAGTYEREQSVIGWTKWTTTGTYESVQVLPTSTTDQVWIAVKRTINGSTKRYIELLSTGDGTSNTDGFSDCYLTYSSPKTISGITKANPGVVTATSHGFSNGDYVKLIGVGGMTEVEGITYIVAGVAANTFQLTDTSGTNVNTTSYTTYTSGGYAHKLVTTISGLSHLEGSTVQVKTDGAAHADRTVSSGSITLDSRHYEAVVGLGYTSTIETLNKEFNLGSGSQQGQPVRWSRPILRLYKSALPTVNGEYLPARDATDLMDSAIGLYTGDASYGPSNWDYEARITIETDEPFPLNILGLFGSIDAGVK